MRVISLFSGAGGLDMGFIQAGHEIVWANDNDFDAVATYTSNIGKHVLLADIANVEAEDIPSADMIVGGFPCQGFSRANLKRSASDERNGLYLEFLRVLKAKRPRYFLAENVRGLLSLEAGRVMQMIVNDFADAGYLVEWWVTNAADYGVPQNRVRVIIVGSRYDVPELLRYRFPEPTHSREGSDGWKQWITIGQALDGIPEPHETHELKNHVCSEYKVTPRDFTGHRSTDPNKPSPTILARGNGQGGVCAIPHPNGRRRLSVRESAIIQTFPNGFVFCGKLNSMYRQVGNAVPVVLASALARPFFDIEHMATGL